MKRISQIDVKAGILTFRGHDVTDLAKNQSFENVLFLLLKGHLPRNQEGMTFRRRLMELRELASSEIPKIIDNTVSSSGQKHTRTTNGIDRTRMLGLRVLAGRVDNYADLFGLDVLQQVLLYVTWAPLVLASEWRKMQGEKIIQPRSDLGHLHNFHWMMSWKELPPDEARDLNSCFILHMDDPDNPSLSKLRECIGNGLSLSDSLVAALDTHISPLHHGAGEQSFKMLMEMDPAVNTEAYLTTRLQQGELIYGLGHRIYRTIDPRARVLEEILRRRAQDNEGSALAKRIEEVSKVGPEIMLRNKGKVVYPNVDLYNAVVYVTFGYPYFMNTELFAVARSAGWAAHIMELSK